MIFCVEDDSNIRELITYTLQQSDYEAMGFPEATSFYKALEKEKPELVILDMMLPGEDGLSILKTLKSNTSTQSIPVMILSAKGSEYDKVLGLDQGADDYVTKPFSMMEFLSRVKAILRRNASSSSENTLHYKDLSLNPKQHKVYLKDEEISLTLKEYELLKKLMENPGTVLTRENLLEQIWGYDYYGETRTVDVHIRTLRSKLEDAASYIETIRGVGYRLEEE